MSQSSDPGLLARFQAAVLDEGSTYRQFVRATGVATVGLVGAYLLLALNVVPLSPAVVSTFEIAVGIAVSVYLLLGLVQFVVIARAYEHGTETVAETADQLEQAVEEVETVAAELDETAATVEDAATEVETAAKEVDEATEQVADTDPDIADEAAERVGEATEKADEATEKAGEATQKADEAREKTGTAKEVADEVKETVEREREVLPEKERPEGDGSGDDEADSGT
jgi:methyl-accepting chemotaxis protein